ncbi:MAG: hypothetical protein COY56_05965 [Flavobacteriaceae bacterium CG_4_10_14_0_8_um_filter_34_31]|nr:MAG: hypothetical protein COY56_05965 [Flavobacteriaceae bacterium CG_4_10_14_0_8_um_filter_34_31]
MTSWWTNICFEKTFTFELCELMAKSGCIAVTGGLKVASDRLLAKLKSPILSLNLPPLKITIASSCL